MGRIDDVLNVSGHRLGTMEIESALVSNNEVASGVNFNSQKDQVEFFQFHICSKYIFFN